MSRSEDRSKVRSRDTFTEAQGHAYLKMLIDRYGVKPLTLPTDMGRPSPVGNWVFTFKEAGQGTGRETG